MIQMLDETLNTTDLILEIGDYHEDYSRRLGTSTMEIRQINLHFLKSDELLPLQEAFTRQGIDFTPAIPEFFAQIDLESGNQRGGMIVLDGKEVNLYYFDNGNPAFEYRGFYPLEQSGSSGDVQRMQAVTRLVGRAEVYLSMLFQSRAHPNPRSAYGVLTRGLICSDTLQGEIDETVGWDACEFDVDSVFN
jgi:hypothetical protein